MKIGDKIKQLRLSKNISQKKLANILNIPVSTLANYENNHREPKLEVIKKIAIALNVDFYEIINSSNITINSVWEQYDSKHAKSITKLTDKYITKGEDFPFKLRKHTSESKIAELKDNEKAYWENLQSLINYVNNLNNLLCEEGIEILNLTQLKNAYGKSNIQGIIPNDVLDILLSAIKILYKIEEIYKETNEEDTISIPYEALEILANSRFGLHSLIDTISFEKNNYLD